MWILRILGPIKFCKGSIKISNGPLKFGNLHAFEWDMGHWSILRAHHHFGLGLSLLRSLFCLFLSGRFTQVLLYIYQLGQSGAKNQFTNLLQFQEKFTESFYPIYRLDFLMHT